jgi:RNA polymerase sigma-70 factor (ECF subfamily)
MPNTDLHTNGLLAIKNNQHKITEIYNEHKGTFLSFSKKNFNLPKEIAEDIYQDAFLSMHQNIQTGKLTELTVPLRTYLFQIGKNKIFDYYKKTKNEIDSGLDDFSPIYEEEESNTEERNLIVYNAVSQMESPCKEILFYYYWEEKSMKEIAQLKEYSNADVAKTQKSKCMKKVKAFIAEKLKKANLI